MSADLRACGTCRLQAGERRIPAAQAPGQPGTGTGQRRSYSPTSARQTGVDGRISRHSLRHTFATIAIDNGVALHNLQDSLRQADPRTTRRYDRSRHKLAKSGGYGVARALA